MVTNNNFGNKRKSANQKYSHCLKNIRTEKGNENGIGKGVGKPYLSGVSGEV